MNSQKTLLITKNTAVAEHLHKRIQQNIQTDWLLYGVSLSSDFFTRLDELTGMFNPVSRIWRVGDYDVALMGGHLTESHEKALQQLKVDYARIDDLPDLSQPGLLLMDMDSTAIQIECIDEIAKLAGVGQEVSEVTERAMQGELDFEQSLRQRVSKLTGADESILEQVRVNLPFMPELQELINALKERGWRTAVASGGFTYFSDYLKEALALDYTQSNTLEIIDGRLTGKVLGEVVSAQIKADILHKLATEYGIARANTVAVGDGANDLIMMDAAGLGIAFHAKPKVVAQARSAIRYAQLGGILCILSASLMLES
ncbi:phosphoserine phosphatase [Vibrio mangrovi]|uniref:Phosphoserine phosphatase n=1 Tax=Vibrio mangrovi TaxID=474394 RepID=A0A1Y6IW60_9VIBR|nr:phosphoserine phosphatase [Vibrio mangrovi]MDW6001690.1 phosphoserine phosphatase [Vibrio mangrovi]SMS00283.1 Phosphoserine phosphatase [Vibrio mangrovi]